MTDEQLMKAHRTEVLEAALKAREALRRMRVYVVTYEEVDDLGNYFAVFDSVHKTRDHAEGRAKVLEREYATPTVQTEELYE